ncbi:hypothetical protein EJB05_50350, partial [Eragrostis curvula]
MDIRIFSLESWSHSSPCSTAGILPSAGILAEKGSDVVEQQQEEVGPEQQKKLATRRRRGRAGAEDAREAAALSRRAARRGGRRRQRSEVGSAGDEHGSAARWVAPAPKSNFAARWDFLLRRGQRSAG